MQLKDKIAIVTGGGSGIGRAIALGFAREGASVAVTDLEGSRAEAVAAEVGAADAMVERTVERFGRLDILVNNAGRAGHGWVTNMTDETWDGVFAVNARGTFACSRAALRHMIPQRSGRILNTASGAGLRPFPGGAVYAASKAAVISLTYSLAEEVAKYGITVNAIGPGPTDTPFWRAQRPEEDVAAAFASGQVGQPEDFVPVVVFLCSDAGAAHSGVMVNRHTYVLGAST